MAQVLHFTDENFATEVQQSDVPVLVDFWAPWCGPCRQIGPVIEQLAKENGDAVKIGKINIDENQRIAGQFGVMSIPTVLVLKDGKAVQKSVGVRPKNEILALFKE